MNDWIDKAAEEYQQQKKERECRESTISLATYWHALLTQLENDIAAINANPAWQEQVTPPVVIEDNPVGGYVIYKRTDPGVTIYFANGGDTIKLDTIIGQTYAPDRKPQRDTLRVVNQGRYVILKYRDQDLIVPQQASQHILSPILKAILDSVEA